MFGSDTRSCVLHCDYPERPLAAGLQGDGAAGGGVLDGVVEQIHEQAPQLGAIPHHLTGTEIGDEVEVALLRLDLP